MTNKHKDPLKALAEKVIQQMIQDIRSEDVTRFEGRLDSEEHYKVLDMIENARIQIHWSK